MLKALFVANIFEVLSRKVDFKIYNFTDWETSSYNAHIARISRSKGNQAMNVGQSTEYNMINIFLEKSYTKSGGEASPRPF